MDSECADVLVKAVHLPSVACKVNENLSVPKCRVGPVKSPHRAKGLRTIEGRLLQGKAMTACKSGHAKSRRQGTPCDASLCIHKKAISDDSGCLGPALHCRDCSCKP